LRYDHACTQKEACELYVGGNELVLLYYPQNDTLRDVCEPNTCGPISVTESHLAKGPPKTFVTNAITFRGQDFEWLSGVEGIFTSLGQPMSLEEALPSILTGQWTFASPTIYLAHRPINARYWTNTFTAVEVSWASIQTTGKRLRLQFRFDRRKSLL
jgi:hypothetical protein